MSGQSAVAWLRDHLGTPYLWGGKDPSRGLDCSGAVVAAWRAAGLGLPWMSAADLEKAAESVSRGALEAGDLVFYGKDRASHVMMYAGNGQVIGASGGGRSTLTTDIAKKQGAEVKVLPVDYRDDVRGYGRVGSGTEKPSNAVAAVGVALVGAAALLLLI